MLKNVFFYDSLMNRKFKRMGLMSVLFLGNLY